MASAMNTTSAADAGAEQRPMQTAPACDAQQQQAQPQPQRQGAQQRGEPLEAGTGPAKESGRPAEEGGKEEAAPALGSADAEQVLAFRRAVVTPDTALE